MSIEKIDFHEPGKSKYLLSEEAYSDLCLRAAKYSEMKRCKDCISRQAVLEMAYDMSEIDGEHFTEPRMVVDIEDILKLSSATSQPKIGHCKDCKWWKDSDGVYRRGIRAESKCPINRREVMEGRGYCYMFELQESEGGADE